jgi:hypothetical protein
MSREAIAHFPSSARAAWNSTDITPGALIYVRRERRSRESLRRSPLLPGSRHMHRGRSAHADTRSCCCHPSRVPRDDLWETRLGPHGVRSRRSEASARRDGWVGGSFASAWKGASCACALHMRSTVYSADRMHEYSAPSRLSTFYLASAAAAGSKCAYPRARRGLDS